MRKGVCGVERDRLDSLSTIRAVVPLTKYTIHAIASKTYTLLRDYERRKGKCSGFECFSDSR